MSKTSILFAAPKGMLRKIKEKNIEECLVFFKTFLPLHTEKFGNNFWPVRLAVRTPDFHSGSRGSIPLRATFKI